MRIYVLAPDEDTLLAAKERYTDPIFRPILLPQTPYLESYMYTNWLMEHHDEWRDEDWVGCIAHRAHEKQPRIFEIGDVMRHASKNGSECCAFLYRGDPLLSAAERWHPGFRDAWNAAWHAAGWDTPQYTALIQQESLMVSFYCNYWATTPQLMRLYCELMGRLRRAIDSDSTLRGILWRDSSYDQRGDAIAKIPADGCRRLWGVDYYPILPFVMERMPCVFFPGYTKLVLMK